MRAGVRAKLVLAWVAIVAAAALVAEPFLAGRLDRLLTDRIRADLFVRLALVEREASAAAGARAPRHEWEALAQDLAHRADARVTFIAADGTVLGDSEVAEARVPEMENHLERPEVQEALAKGRGASVRHSATLGERMMYAAAPYRMGPSVAGVVRVAVPLTEVGHAIGDLRRALAAAAGVMLLAAFVLSGLAAQWLSGPVRRLTGVATAMAGGDLSVRTRLAGHDELARLGRALDELALSLSHTVGELRDERDRLDRILKGMHEGVLLLGADGRVVLVNPALRSMLLLGVDVVGRSLLEIVRHGGLKELLDRARDTASEVSDEIVVQGLEPRRLLVHAVRLAGEPPGILAVFVDVTDLRRLETLRRDFVANASHELRTPIAAVRSAADTLVDALEHDPDAAPGFVAMIQRNAERLQRLVDDLLDLSRIEAHELRLRPEALELGPIVRAAVAPFEERARRRRVALGVDVPVELGPVHADRRVLEQILTNLVDNAVKYCTEGAEVRVRARADAAEVELTVEDTGPGIEPRHLPRLFERFYRVDAGRSRELGGTGLGLAIVKHLAEAMGGSVTVESTPGEGSRFVVSLPRRPAGLA